MYSIFKIITGTFIGACLTLCAMEAFAHKGRLTDGCHNSRAAEEYHCHDKETKEVKVIATKETIKEVCEIIGGGMSTTAQFNKTLLNKIHKDNTITDDNTDKEQLAKMIQAGLVFAYCNGKTYYKINPTILKSIQD